MVVANTNLIRMKILNSIQTLVASTLQVSGRSSSLLLKLKASNPLLLELSEKFSISNLSQSQVEASMMQVGPLHGSET
jgi:hypothetical protein